MHGRNWFCDVQRILFSALILSLLIMPAQAQTQEDIPNEGEADITATEKAAFEETLKKAKAGDISLQFELSHLYRDGEGTEQDIKEADYWLQKSAEKGYSQAQVELGKDLIAKQDYKAAFQWFMAAAQAGDMEGQNILGDFYHEGHGTEVNYDEALRWKMKAAAQGSNHAAYSIGYMYNNGQGIPADNQKAFQWYKLTADRGYALGQSRVGLCYRMGIGVSQDFKEAERWYMLAANQDEATAQYGLAIIYLDGPAEMRNPEKAVPLLERAIEQNYTPASLVFATLYWSGEVPSLKKDPGRAIELARPAAEKGIVYAQRVMGVAEQAIDNYAAATSWFRKAAEQDDGYSTFYLAKLYQNGQGVPRDFDQAAKLYIRANDLIENAAVANSAGWFFATCEDPKYRNPELAMKYALRAVNLTSSQNAAFMDTLAEAYFINGQYDRAVSTEERALELEPKTEEFKKSLAKFRAALGSTRVKPSNPAVVK